MTSGDISKRISELYQRVQDLRTQSLSHPDQAIDVLSDALRELEASIEELSAAEEELRASEEKHRTIVETANEGIIMVDAESQITYVNNKFADMLGYCPEELIGKNITDYFDKEHLALALAKREERRQYGVRNSYESKLIRKDGSPLWVMVNSSPILDYDGRFAGSLGMVTDITERKKAEEALCQLNSELEQRVAERTSELVKAAEKIQAERQRFLHILDTLPIIIDIIRQDHRIEWANSAYREALGDNQGRLCFASQFGRDKPCEECQAFIPLDTGQPHHWEWTLPNGRTFDIYNFPFADADGLPMILEMDIDITERREAEAEVLKAKDALEDVNEKLAVQNKELLAAKIAAEAAAQAKAAFLANMSHELRTPMNAVIGFSSLLLDESLTPDQRDYIERIKNGGEALLAIISDILDVSKAEKDKIELEHQPFNLQSCIEESLDLVASQATEKGLNLAYTVSYGTPDAIMGDHGRLRQVLVNLLSNAVKFTDVGAVSLSVSSKVIEENMHQISFKVVDTGIGIPEDKIDRLFKPFNQVEHVISRKRDGAGLGLAISKRLVELMGGEIWAESNEGKGSTFHFTIRAEAIPSKRLDLTDANKDIAYRNLAEQTPMAILVAEDNPSNQRVLVEMLKRMGYRPDAVADGREVLQALEIRPYNLVLLDVKMPEMDGLEAARQIRKTWPAEKQPRIIAITAYAMDGDKEMCLEAGMDDYLAKPVQMKDLEAILMKYSGEPA